MWFLDDGWWVWSARLGCIGRSGAYFESIIGCASGPEPKSPRSRVSLASLFQNLQKSFFFISKCRTFSTLWWRRRWRRRWRYARVESRRAATSHFPRLHSSSSSINFIPSKDSLTRNLELCLGRHTLFSSYQQLLILNIESFNLSSRSR